MKIEICSRAHSARLAILVMLLAASCQQEQVVTFDEQNWEGNVDASQSQEVQAKQRALIHLFRAIQEDGFEHVQLRNIRFDETYDDFFGEAADFHRWNWGGPPEGDRFPVTLTLRLDEPGLPEVEHRRVYEIQKIGERFVITRVAPARQPSRPP